MTEPAIWLNTTPLTDAHWRRLPPALRARLRHRLGGKASILNRQVLDIAQALCERGTYDLAFGFYQVLDGQPLMPYQGCGFGLMMSLKALMGERARSDGGHSGANLIYVGRNSSRGRRIMEAVPGEGEIYRPSMEDLGEAVYRDAWLKIIGRKLEALGDSRQDFGKRCNLVRQAYMEMGDIVLTAARRGHIASPYFLCWDEFWQKSPPEFALWWSIRYYGVMPLYPQYPVLNYFVDFGDPWQRVGIEADGRSYHDEGKDLRRDEELFELGWKVFRIPEVQTRPGYLGPDDAFRDLDEGAQRARLSRWLLETFDGVIRALKTLYYEQWTPSEYASWFGLSEEMGDLFIQRCYQTLDRHRLVRTFELPNLPDGNGPWKPWEACFE